MSNYFASVPKTEASDFLINSWQGFYFFLFLASLLNNFFLYLKK